MPCVAKRLFFSVVLDLTFCLSFKTTAIDRMRLAVKSLWPRAQVCD
jgi:hypothetical protein